MGIPLIDQVLNRNAGIATMAEFLAVRVNPDEVRIHREYGSLVMIRKGWYARPGLPADIIAAVRVGGRLGCVSALAYHGEGIVPEHVHVALPPGASRLRRPHDRRRRLDRADPVVLHWCREPLTGDRRAVGAEQARTQAQSCWALATATTP